MTESKSSCWSCGDNTGYWKYKKTIEKKKSNLLSHTVKQAISPIDSVQNKVHQERDSAEIIFLPEREIEYFRWASEKRTEEWNLCVATQTNMAAQSCCATVSVIQPTAVQNKHVRPEVWICRGPGFSSSCWKAAVVTGIGIVLRVVWCKSLSMATVAWRVINSRYSVTADIFLPSPIILITPSICERKWSKTSHSVEPL